MKNSHFVKWNILKLLNYNKTILDTIFFYKKNEEYLSKLIVY